MGQHDLNDCVFSPPVGMTLEEIDAMLAENIDRLKRQIREKGFQQVFQEGLQGGFQRGFLECFHRGFLEGFREGFLEGEARVVLRLLGSKFGPLAPEVEERVRSADEDRLLEWGDRVLSAQSLKDVLRD